MMINSPEFADDALIGANAIAKYLFGQADKSTRRKVFHLSRTSRLPTFHLGARLCARKSRLMAWVIAQENRKSGQTSETSPRAAGATEA